jgi:hypothetical protein
MVSIMAFDPSGRAFDFFVWETDNTWKAVILSPQGLHMVFYAFL